MSWPNHLLPWWKIRGYLIKMRHRWPICAFKRGGGMITLLDQPLGLARVRRDFSCQKVRERSPPLWARERKGTPSLAKGREREKNTNAHSCDGALYPWLWSSCTWAKPSFIWCSLWSHWLPSCMLTCTHTHCLDLDSTTMHGHVPCFHAHVA